MGRGLFLSNWMLRIKVMKNLEINVYLSSWVG